MIKNTILKVIIILNVLLMAFTQNISAFQTVKSDPISYFANLEKLSDKLGSIINGDEDKEKSIVALSVENAVESQNFLGISLNDNLYHIYVSFTDNFTEEDLEVYGKFDNYSSQFKMADMWLDLKKIAALSLNSDVLNITEVTQATFMSGNYLSEGYSDLTHGVASYLNAGNLAGDGIKIGVISDGVSNISSAVNSGDIPANVVVLNNRYGGDEGTAMLEIVHDMAPNAKLYFSDHGNSVLGFNNSIKALVDAGCNIIVDDIVYFSEPFFEDGIISQYIESYATPKGVLYLSSAGNFADNHYQGTYTSTDNYTNYEQDFNSNASLIQHLPITIPAYTTVTVVLQWSDPYTNSSNNLSLKLCTSDYMTTCYTSDNNQLGSGYAPYEQFSLINNSYFTYTYYVGVYSKVPMSNLQIEIYAFNGKVQKYGVRSDSTFGHSTSKSVLSIAAVNQQSISTTRSYSSIGPFTMRDGTTRNKPDFSGVDNVTVSGAGGFSSPFNGTSAAAPHIAGIAALLLSNDKTLTAPLLVSLLKSKSYDLMDRGYDYNSGYGLVTLNESGLDFQVLKNQPKTYSLIFDRLVNASVENTSIVNFSLNSITSIYDFGIERFRYSFSLAGKSTGTSVLTFTDNNGQVQLKRNVYSRNPIQSISITDPVRYVELGECYLLNVLYEPLDADDSLLTYQSSNNEIVEVDSNGNVTAKSIGLATITVTNSSTGRSATQTIYVGILSESITIDKKIVSIEGVGKQLALSASILPNNSTYPNILWSSSDTKILTVDANGLVTSIKAGSATIIAMTQDGRYSDEIAINVVVTLKNIYFEDSALTIEKAGSIVTQQLNLIKDPSNTTDTIFNWTSSNPSIVSVDSNGLVSVKDFGSAEITVTGSHNTSASIVIKVVRKTFTIQLMFNRIPFSTGGFSYRTSYIYSKYGDTITLNDLINYTQQNITELLPYSLSFFYYRYLGYEPPLTGSLYMDQDYIINIVKTPTAVAGIKFTEVNVGSSEVSVSGNFTPANPYNTKWIITSSNESVIKSQISYSNGWSCSNSEDLIPHACFNSSLLIVDVGKTKLTVTTEEGSFMDSIEIEVVKNGSIYNVLSNVVSFTNVRNTSYNEISLMWNGANGSMGFEIYRATSFSGTYSLLLKKVVTLGQYSYSYADTNLNFNTEYFYKIRSYKTISGTTTYGPYSIVLAAKTVPVTPSIISAMNISLDTINVSYSTYQSSNGYQLAYSDSNSGVYLELPITTASSQAISGLQFNKHYYFKVRHFMLEGTTKVFSRYSSVFSMISSTPIPVLSIGLLRYNSVNLSWSESIGADGYELESLNHLSNEFELLFDSTNLDYLHENLDPSFIYQYRIRSYKLQDGVRLYSGYSTVLLCQPKLVAPTNLSTQNFSYDRLTINWSPVQDAIGYEVYRSTSATGSYTLIGSPTTSNYISSSLAFNTSYFYKVRAYAFIGSNKVYGDYSSVLSAKTTLSTSIITPVSGGYDRVTVSWTAVSGASGYEIYSSIGTSATYALLKAVTTASFSHTALATNTKYNYKVRAYRLVGTAKVYGAFSSIVSSVPIPSNPTSLSVTSIGYNSLKIAWAAVSGASGYEVSYATSEGGTYTNLALLTTTSASIPSLITNTSYYVRVRAYRLVGTTKVYSGYSSVVSNKPIPSTPVLTATSIAYDSLKITWAAIAGATGYELYHLDPSTSAYDLLSDTALLTYTESGLVTGANSSYKIKAYRLVGDTKVYSLESTVITAKAIPSTVTGFAVSSPKYSELSLSWTAVTGATGYEVSRSTAIAGTYTVLANVESAVSYVSTGLAFNTTYYYKIRPYTTVNSVKVYGGLSAVVSGKTALVSVSGQAARSTSYTSNYVSWPAVTGASGYEIYFSKGTSATYTLLKALTTTSFSHTALTTNTKYNYKVRAYRLVGKVKVYGAFSSIVSSIPVPAIPTALSVASSGYNSLRVTWAAVGGASGYEISYATSELGTYTKLALQTALSASIPSLVTKTSYYVKVRAYRLVGTTKVYGGYSTIVSNKPIPSTPVLTVASIAYDSLKISWPAIAGASGYELLHTNLGSNVFHLLSDTTALTYTESGLVSGYNTSYYIRAYVMVGDTKIYSLDSAIVIGKAVPTPVTGFVLTMPGVSTLSLGWTAVPNASGYEVSRSAAVAGTYTVLANVESAVAYTSTGLSFNTSYYYKIRPYITVSDVKVYGAYSAVISGKTIPSTVVLTVSNPNYTTNSLSWPAISGAGGYEIYYSKGTSATYVLLKAVTSLSYSHTALVYNTKYNYKVRAYKLSGSTKIYGAFSSIKSSTVLVSAPTLTSTSTSDSVSLSWAAVSGSSGYEVSYSTTLAGTYTATLQTTLTKTYLGLTPGSTYYFRVRAYRLVGTVKVYGPYSSVLEVTPTLS